MTEEALAESPSGHMLPQIWGNCREAALGCKHVNDHFEAGAADLSTYAAKRRYSVSSLSMQQGPRQPWKFALLRLGWESGQYAGQ